MTIKIVINNDELKGLLEINNKDFPKYSTQLINLANQNAQATRPKVVGKLSELIQEFDGKTLDEWMEWYLEKYPDSLETATNKIFEKLQEMSLVLPEITKEMIYDWVEDLVINKTFFGLKFQSAIIKHIADKNKLSYRLANPTEESQGIDGYIGKKAISVKPISYKLKLSLSEEIKVDVIWYNKMKNAVEFTYDIEFEWWRNSLLLNK